MSVKQMKTKDFAFGKRISCNKTMLSQDYEIIID